MPSARAGVSDLAAAYFGLCTLALSPSQLNRLELGYFFCKRAEQFFSRLPTKMRETSLNRQNEASTINYVGLSLYWADSTVAPAPELVMFKRMPSILRRIFPYLPAAKTRLSLRLRE